MLQEKLELENEREAELMDGSRDWNLLMQELSFDPTYDKGDLVVGLGSSNQTVQGYDPSLSFCIAS